MKKRVIIALVVVVAVVAVAIVLLRTPPDQDSKQPVKVGSILSLTGTLANYGELEKRGFDLAVKRINENGGINGRPLEVIYEDSQLEPATAISAYRKLTSHDHVPMIVGCIGSSVCLAITPLASEDKVVVLSAGATAPKLSGSSPYFFRVAPSDTLGAAKLAEWALHDGSKRIAILYVENDYGVGQKDVALKYLTDANVPPVIIESCQPEATDLRAQLEKIRSANVEAVLLLTHSPEAGYFLKQAAETGFKAKYYGGDALSDPSIVQIAGNACEGVMFLLPAKGSGPEYEAFAKAYRDAYNAEPDAVGLKAYCLMLVAADALRNADYSGPALRGYIAQLSGFATPMGPITFDQNGDIVDVKFDHLRYENGKAVVMP